MEWALAAEEEGIGRLRPVACRRRRECQRRRPRATRSSSERSRAWCPRFLPPRSPRSSSALSSSTTGKRGSDCAAFFCAACFTSGVTTCKCVSQGVVPGTWMYLSRFPAVFCAHPCHVSGVSLRLAVRVFRHLRACGDNRIIDASHVWLQVVLRCLRLTEQTVDRSCAFLRCGRRAPSTT